MFAKTQERLILVNLAVENTCTVRNLEVFGYEVVLELLSRRNCRKAFSKCICATAGNMYSTRCVAGDDIFASIRYRLVSRKKHGAYVLKSRAEFVGRA
jgi:hypothetical protein